MPAPGWKRSTVNDAVCADAPAETPSASAAAARRLRRRSANASTINSIGQIAGPACEQPAPATTQIPGSFRERQAPATQSEPAEQSPSEEQALLQAFGPQMYAPQLDCVRAGQLPAPSHEAAAVEIPAEQLEARHCVAALGYAQTVREEPSQVPPQALPSVAQAGRPSRGSPTTAVQTPTLPPTLHASHWPLQAVSQQTPSTQLPLPH